MSENNETTQTTDKERFFNLVEFLFNSETIIHYTDTKDLGELIKEAYDFTHKEVV